MRISKSGNEIHSVEDWFRCAPPKMGKLHWKDGRSAKELPESWFRHGLPKAPDELSVLLESKFGTGIIFDEVKPECIIELDEVPGEHRNCDLVALCRSGTHHIAINIEAKADEPFGENTVGIYHDQKANSQSNVPADLCGGRWATGVPTATGLKPTERLQASRGCRCRGQQRTRKTHSSE